MPPARLGGIRLTGLGLLIDAGRLNAAHFLLSSRGVSKSNGEGVQRLLRALKVWNGGAEGEKGGLGCL